MSSVHKRRVIFAGAGTAGHVEPALAVARWLRKEDPSIEIVFLGTAQGVENTLVPAAGFELVTIRKAAFPRTLNPAALLWPLRFTQSLLQVYRSVRRSTLVIGFGGYVCAPAYVAARLARVEAFAHEANAKAGMANKLGARLGATLMRAFEGAGEGLVVGIPLRSEITHLARVSAAERATMRTQALCSLGLDPARKTLLIFGGSLGSAKFNSAIAGALSEIVNSGVQVIHSVGGKNELPPASPGYLPVQYISDMAQAYAAADCVISRSGAVSVTETGVLGLYAIYVPLDIGNGEQLFNARIVVDQGGGEIVANKEFSSELIIQSLPGWMERAEKYRASGVAMNFPLDSAMRIGVKALSALRVAEKRRGASRG